MGDQDLTEILCIRSLFVMLKTAKSLVYSMPLGHAHCQTKFKTLNAYERFSQSLEITENQVVYKYKY